MTDTPVESKSLYCSFMSLQVNPNPTVGLYIHTTVADTVKPSHAFPILSLLVLLITILYTYFIHSKTIHVAQVMVIHDRIYNTCNILPTCADHTVSCNSI